jgi:hypothetical protein
MDELSTSKIDVRTEENIKKNVVIRLSMSKPMKSSIDTSNRSCSNLLKFDAFVLGQDQRWTHVDKCSSNIRQLNRTHANNIDPSSHSSKSYKSIVIVTSAMHLVLTLSSDSSLRIVVIFCSCCIQSRSRHRFVCH